MGLSSVTSYVQRSIYVIDRRLAATYQAPYSPASYSTTPASQCQIPKRCLLSPPPSFPKSVNSSPHSWNPFTKARLRSCSFGSPKWAQLTHSRPARPRGRPRRQRRLHRRAFLLSQRFGAAGGRPLTHHLRAGRSAGHQDVLAQPDGAPVPSACGRRTFLRRRRGCGRQTHHTAARAATRAGRRPRARARRADAGVRRAHPRRGAPARSACRHRRRKRPSRMVDWR